MARLSISEAWSETASFVKREGRLLFPLAFMLVALPVAVLQAFTPTPPAPDQPPPAGLWLLLLPITLVASMVGNLAISYLALRPGVSVGEAIAHGGRRFFSLLGAVLILSIVGIALALVVATIVVALVPGAASGGGVPTPATAAAMLILMLLMLPVVVYVSARLMVMTPLAAAESVGPIAIIRRSWKLTAGHGLKLVAFILLVGLTYVVGTAAIQIVAGLVILVFAGPPQPGSLGALLLIIIMAGVNTAVGPYLTSLIARVYAQLAPTDRSALLA